jgi:hypothetical protein
MQHGVGQLRRLGTRHTPQVAVVTDMSELDLRHVLAAVVRFAGSSRR